MGNTKRPTDKEVIGDLMDALEAAAEPEEGQPARLRMRGATAKRPSRSSESKPDAQTEPGAQVSTYSVGGITISLGQPPIPAPLPAREQFATTDDCEYTEPVESTENAGRTVSEGSPTEHSRHGQRLLMIANRINRERVKAKAELERTLNDYLKNAHPAGPEAKKQLADWVTGFLRAAGFAFDYKNTHCYLYFTYGKKDKKGHFRLTPKGATHYLIAPENLSELLPLTIIDASPPLLPPPSWNPPSPSPAVSPDQWEDRVNSGPNKSPHR